METSGGEIKISFKGVDIEKRDCLTKEDFLNMCNRQDTLLVSPVIEESQCYTGTRWSKTIGGGIQMSSITKKINGDLYITKKNLVNGMWEPINLE